MINFISCNWTAIYSHIFFLVVISSIESKHIDREMDNWIAMELDSFDQQQFRYKACIDFVTHTRSFGRERAETHKRSKYVGHIQEEIERLTLVQMMEAHWIRLILTARGGSRFRWKRKGLWGKQLPFLSSCLISIRNSYYVVWICWFLVWRVV